MRTDGMRIMRTGGMRTRLAALVAIALALPVLAIGLSNALSGSPSAITLSTGHALVGTTVKLQGDNFPRMSAGNLSVGNTEIATLQTGRYGHFSGSFKIPAVAGGQTTITAVVGAQRVAVPFMIDTVSSESVRQPVVRSTVSAHGGATVVTPTFDAAAGDLIVVGVSSDGPSTTPQALTVSGAGLSWNRVIRGNSQPGSAEVWYADARSGLSDATVTSKQGSPLGSQFVNVSVVSGARGVGAVQSQSAVTPHPSATIRTVDNASLLLGVANDWTRPSHPAVGAGETMVSSYTDTSTGDTYWAQAGTQKLSAGSLATLDATLATSDRVNLAMVEVLADGGSAPLTTTTTTTAPPATAGTTTTSTTTPPPADPPGDGTLPDGTNTGPRIPVSSMRQISGSTTATALGVGAGGTISGVHVTGELTLDVPNVKVVDSWIEDGINVTWRGGNATRGAGAVVDHVELGPNGSAYGGGDAIGDDHYTLTYSNVHNFGDGLRTNGGNDIEHNWIHNLLDPTGGVHNDGIQSTAGDGNITIRYNLIENQQNQTSCIGIGADTGTQNGQVDVENNWLAGGGYSLYPTPNTVPAIPPIYRNNVFLRTIWPKGGFYGPIYGWGKNAVHSGNHFDNGQSVD
ncbi:MAG TPA: hypothetical protein VIC35_05545 [Acidimicrobiia bacterium]